MKKETGKKKEQVEKRSVFPFDFFHLLFHFSHMGWKKKFIFHRKRKKEKNNNNFSLQIKSNQKTFK